MSRGPKLEPGDPGGSWLTHAHSNEDGVLDSAHHEGLHPAVLLVAYFTELQPSNELTYPIQTDVSYYYLRS